MENNYIKNGNNRVENPCMTQGEGKNRGRRGREEGKHWIGWRMLRVAVVLGVMMGWGVSEVWGATVTYHIINLGKLDNNGQLTSTRTEALQFTSTSLTVGLPNQYKSPLAKNWQYYSSSDVTYNTSTKEYVFNTGPSLSVGDALSDGDHVYVTYEFDNEALSTIGLFDGGICKIKFNLTNQYLQQTVWQGNPNTGSYALQEDPSFYWKVNIKDPYQITIQSQSTTYLDYYLSADAGKFADIRLKNTLSTAISNKVWAFGLLPDAPTNTYRLIVTDGYTYHPNQDGIDQFGHGYLNNNDIKDGVRKTRYQKYSGSSYSNCALTFEPLTKTYIILNSLGETLVQATTTDYPLEVPDVIKSPFATYSYYSDAAFTHEISAVGNTTTIYVRYTTTSSSLNLNGGTEYYVHTNNNYWYAVNATTIGIANSFADPTSETKWTLNGNDAYQLTIKNVGNNNEVTYDVSSGEAVPTLSGTGSKFFLHQSNTGQYEVVAVSSGDYTTGYYSMGVANNTLKLYSSSNYPFGQDEVQSVFLTQIACAKPVIAFDYTTGQVTISTATAGATIHYTTDGTEPTTSSQSHSNPFTINSTTTIKAIAVKTGFDNSEMAERTIEQVATPTIQNNGSNAVFITCATPDATIYYAIGSSPVVGTSPTYTTPLTEGVSGQTIYAIAVKENMLNSAVGSGTVTLQCAAPVITRNGNSGFIATCAFPATGVTIYYTTDGSTTPTTSTPTHINSGESVAIALPVTVKAIAVATNYNNSSVTTTTVTQGMGGSGTEADPYTIEYQSDVDDFITKANDPALADKYYKVISADPLDFSSADEITQPFSGNFDGNLQTFTGLSHALFNTVDGGTVRNVMLKSVSISTSGNVGAICNTAEGAARIYNCGILPTDPNFTTTSSIGSTTTSGSDGYCGSLVGLLDGTARVINCFSYANITGGNIVGGIVGNNNTSDANQNNYTTKTIVMNCFFYGDIDTTHVGGTPKNAFPVYGGNVIANDGTASINNYNYYRDLATFDNSYGDIARYNRSWPAEERNIRRFEYYRSILNSNRRLCTFWITDHDHANQTADDTALVAKWALDRSIAPYPVLKPWGKYPSIINPDPEKVWDTVNNAWVQRSSALPYQGKSHGTLSVTVKPGSHNSSASDVQQSLTITEMDTLNYDYGYYKVQLPYYNELFGDPSSNVHTTRYGNNYTDKVVTGWKIISVNSNDQGAGYTFDDNWESGCNFADRSDKYKDLYAKSGRVFAQGGYYYVPEGVTSITIEAYWGTALYLHGKDHAVDRVNVTNSANYGNAFTPAGTLPTTWDYNSMTIYDDLPTVVGALSNASSVYDQAIVLVGNFPVQALNSISLDNTTKRVTFMSADLDMDNEPDFIFPLQWRNNTDRRPILPVRFDFLPIPELGMVMRHNTYAYAIGIMVPRGHFEITETSFMHTTQFEYMSSSANTNHQQPLILNGGQFEQIVVHGAGSSSMANTRNIILGGHVWMKRFTPGSHTGQHAYTRHCAVSVMGGDFPEFYLTGLYWTDVTTDKAYNDNPHCYTNGGRFGIMAGAGMEAVKNSVYFEIDHSVIDEFYGGGINANNPVAGNINVTINNSLVLDKYCGGPKVGTSQTVTTNATGTIFNQYYGGGNGGTNLYREQIADKTPNDMPTESGWRRTSGDYKYDNFTPISTQGATATYNASKGYHAQYEFEVFNQSNGIDASAVARTYYHWAQFGTTETGNVTNNLSHCTVNNNFYAGGNLGNVSGTVTSTLDSCTVNGSAFGGGYSASIPHFPVHHKDSVTFPYRDAAGVCHNGSVGYRTDEAPNDTVIQYTWCYKNPSTNVVSPAGVVIPDGVTTSKPAFQYNNKWYCYTTVSLEGLGAVSSHATLTIKGNTEVTGNVYGGGDESIVTGNTTVILQQGAHILGNVFGGGNRGAVSGSSEVRIQDPEP